MIDDAKFDTYTNVGLYRIEGSKRSMQLSVEEEDEEESTITHWTCIASLHSVSSIGTVVQEFEVGRWSL